MTATYTFDIFSSLDGFGSYDGGNWGGYPVITGRTGVDPIFQGAADFDLELIESRTPDGNIQELIYRPTLHV
jgi:hypothetical protein